MKNILFINTGGTISSSAAGKGLTPTQSAADIISAVPEVKEICNVEAMTLMSVDSTNIQPEEWVTIARTVHEQLPSYDGIVIAHGTDTMAYTASALSFMLGALDKPVVITGSQVSVLAEYSDSRKNIKDSFLTASSELSGVFVVFNGKIINGARASKVKTKSYDAFESINHPYIGYLDEDHIVYNEIEPSVYPEGHVYNDQYSPDVFLLKLIPGMRPDIFDAVRNLGYKGIIVEGFGLGGVPFKEINLIDKIEELVQDGISIVVTTQCLYEGGDLTIYEVGQRALEKGVIPCYDMTTEALTTKMMWVLGQANSPAEVARMMATNYVDEITMPILR
ncbi:asparaginase [Paenibacillus bovis]|uniref:asparaginase n=1 Tax=Paenibacillus bovis TaxID=1616788 RepID=A0A172ZBX0_9BACL|nr:asparaginase [Paenibacillus bovis]ANF94862.1 L-asparaginase 1 [Paenibacillus bovis]